MSRHVIFRSFVVGIVLLAFLGVDGLAQKGIPRPSFPSGFAPGTRVMLLANEPAVAPGLEAGMAGTVVCCDAEDCSGSLLVSWDLFSGGQDEEARCVIPAVGPYPPGATAWVDPAQVPLGRPFDEVGILQEDPAGCLYLGTDDGRLFHLVIGPEFREQWWMVRGGNGVRVRGWLSTTASDLKAEGACPQRDGDVYHPIMSLYIWEDPECCDRWVCGFGYGDPVVLIGEDDPSGALDLPRGTSGTIICCRGDENPSILVSWNLWENGGPDEAYVECTERLAGLFPPGSTCWVSVKDVAGVLESECGIVQEMSLSVGGVPLDPEAVGLFAGRDKVYYLPDVDLARPLPRDRFRAIGLFTPYGDLVGGQVVASDAALNHGINGIILSSVLALCPEASCCEPSFAPGDRVELLVDQPGGASLSIGATGTVLCCNADDPATPILVCWDNWTDGHDDDEQCDVPPEWYPDDSAWWMACTEIERIVLPDLFDRGEEFRAFVPQTLEAGKEGQVLKVTGMIGNRGGAQSGPFLVEIYLSTDRNITREDIRLANAAMDVDPDGEAALSWMGPFPTDVPAGVYSIGWLIDSEDEVAEADETNNTAAIETVQLTVR